LLSLHSFRNDDDGFVPSITTFDDGHQHTSRDDVENRTIAPRRGPLLVSVEFQKSR